MCYIAIVHKKALTRLPYLVPDQKEAQHDMRLVQETNTSTRSDDSDLRLCHSVVCSWLGGEEALFIFVVVPSPDARVRNIISLTFLSRVHRQDI